MAAVMGTILFTVLLCLLGLGVYFLLSGAVGVLDPYAPDERKTKKVTDGLSSPAGELYREYMALPESSRPFDDIIPILKALDENTGPAPNPDRRYHFVRWDKFVWNDGCNHRYCDFRGYYDLHVQIEKVAKALEEKERAMVLAKNQGRMLELETLIESLRTEAEIQNEVTKEIS